MDEDRDLISEIARAVARQRGYADFFDWPDKRQKELGLLHAFAEAVDHIPHLRLSEARLTPHDEDPPDALARCAANGNVGIEITELVDERLIEQQRKMNEPQWREWTRGQFRSALQEVIRRKDSATLKSPAPSNYWIVVHTDEPALTPEQVRAYLADWVVGPCSLITRCFLLMSYHPQQSKYPVLEVSVDRAP